MEDRDTKRDELIVFVIRETGWTLEYVRELPLDDLFALVKELSYQKAIDEYKMALNFAMVISNWATAMSKHKRYRPTQFVGEPPDRKAFIKEVTSDEEKDTSPNTET